MTAAKDKAAKAAEPVKAPDAPPIPEKQPDQAPPADTPPITEAPPAAPDTPPTPPVAPAPEPQAPKGKAKAVAVFSPNRAYNGTTAGIQFVDGNGEIPADAQPHLAGWFREHGYTTGKKPQE